MRRISKPLYDGQCYRGNQHQNSQNDDRSPTYQQYQPSQQNLDSSQQSYSKEYQQGQYNVRGGGLALTNYNNHLRAGNNSSESLNSHPYMVNQRRNQMSPAINKDAQITVTRRHNHTNEDQDNLESTKTKNYFQQEGLTSNKDMKNQISQLNRREYHPNNDKNKQIVSSKHLVSFSNINSNTFLSSIHPYNNIKQSKEGSFYESNLSQNYSIFHNGRQGNRKVQQKHDSYNDKRRLLNKENQQPNSISSSKVSQNNNKKQQFHEYDDGSKQNRRRNNDIRRPNHNNNIYRHLTTNSSPEKNQNQHHNELLLPVINTNNYHSNTLSQESSITPIQQSDLLIVDASVMVKKNQAGSLIRSNKQPQQQTQFLKQKLIQTHNKLIKELQISKQMEENFYSLKAKYDNLISQRTKQMAEEKKKDKINQQEKLLLQKQKHKDQQLISKLTEKLQSFALKERQYQELITQLQNANNAVSSQLSLKKYSAHDIDQVINNEKATHNIQLQKTKSKNLQLRSDLENMRNKILNLIKDKQNGQEQIQDIKNAKEEEIKQYRSKIQQLEQKIRKLQREFSEKQQLCEIWRKKCSQGQEQFNKRQEAYFKKEKQLKQTKELSQELSIALRQQKQKNAQMLSEIISIQIQTKEVKNKYAALQEQKIQLQDKLVACLPQKNVQHQKSQLQQQLQKLNMSYNQLSATIAKRDKQLTEIRNQLVEKAKIIRTFEANQKNKYREANQMDSSERKYKNIQNAPNTAGIDYRQNFMIENEKKANRMSSVKDFVTRLEEQNEKSTIIRRVSQQQIVRQNLDTINSNNIMIQHNLQNQNAIRYQNPSPQKLNPMKSGNIQAQCNRPVSPKLSPISSNTKYQKKVFPPPSNNGFPSNKNHPNQNFHMLICENEQEQDFQQALYKVTHHKGQQINQNQHYNQQSAAYNEEQQYQQNRSANTRKNQEPDNKQTEYYYQDSLQSSYKLQKPTQSSKEINVKNKNTLSINKQTPLTQNNQQQSRPQSNNHKNKLTPSKNMAKNSQDCINQDLRQKTNTKSKSPFKQQTQKNLTSYKQQKQQYMSLLSEITELQTQSYNLGEEKAKILDQLDKIQATKVKNKELIAKRRQLELWLLGNDKKNNELKLKLKSLRGKVV